MILILFILLKSKEIFCNHIYFFPTSIKTNWRNNHAFLFESHLLTEKKMFFIIHKGKEGFQLLLQEPISTKNMLFEINNECSVIEGKFHISLLIKNTYQRVIEIPFKNSEISYNYLEEKSQPYHIYIDKSILIRHIRHFNKDLFSLMEFDILGIKIIPLTTRTAFYCDKFTMTYETFLIH